MAVKPWNFVVLEGYCMYGAQKPKTKHPLRLVSVEAWKARNIAKRKVQSYLNGDRPNWCANQNKSFTPQFRCLTCKYFGYSATPNEDLKFLKQAWENKK